MALKVWLIYQKHQHHPRTCQKCTFLSPNPDLLNKKLWSGVQPSVFTALQGASEAHQTKIATALNQTSANFFYKKPDNKYFSLCRAVLVFTSASVAQKQPQTICKSMGAVSVLGTAVLPNHKNR